MTEVEPAADPAQDLGSVILQVPRKYQRWLKRYLLPPLVDAGAEEGNGSDQPFTFTTMLKPICLLGYYELYFSLAGLRCRAFFARAGESVFVEVSASESRLLREAEQTGFPLLVDRNHLRCANASQPSGEII